MVCLRLISDEDLGRFRTKSCRRLQSGECRFNDRCQYSHDRNWPRRCPFLLADKMPILSTLRYLPMFCPYSTPGSEKSCIRGSRCTLAHTKEEVYYHPLMYKRFPCIAFEESGKCNDFYCPWIHSVKELRGEISYFLSVPSTMLPRKRFPRLSNASTASCTTEGSQLKFEEDAFHMLANASEFTDSSMPPTSEGFVSDSIPPLLQVIPKKDVGSAATAFNLSEISVYPSGPFESRNAVEGDTVLVAIEFAERSVRRVMEQNKKNFAENENIRFITHYDESLPCSLPKPLLCAVTGEGLRVVSVGHGVYSSWMYCERVSFSSPESNGWIHVSHLFGEGRVPLEMKEETSKNPIGLPFGMNLQKLQLPESITFGSGAKIGCKEHNLQTDPAGLVPTNTSSMNDYTANPHCFAPMLLPSTKTFSSETSFPDELSNLAGSSDLTTTACTLLESLGCTDQATAQKLLVDLLLMVEQPESSRNINRDDAYDNERLLYNKMYTDPTEKDENTDSLNSTFQLLGGSENFGSHISQITAIKDSTVDMCDEEVCALLASVMHRDTQGCSFLFK